MNDEQFNKWRYSKPPEHWVHYHPGAAKLGWDAAIEQRNQEIERAYQTLSSYGVSKERARSVANGIMVLVTRMDKEIAGLNYAIEQMKPAEKVCRWKSIKDISYTQYYDACDYNSMVSKRGDFCPFCGGKIEIEGEGV